MKATQLYRKHNGENSATLFNVQSVDETRSPTKGMGR